MVELEDLWKKDFLDENTSGADKGVCGGIPNCSLGFSSLNPTKLLVVYLSDIVTTFLCLGADVDGAHLDEADVAKLPG
ncbi:unnamed protein product [Rhodiola kirilowii]